MRKDIFDNGNLQFFTNDSNYIHDLFMRIFVGKQTV